MKKRVSCSIILFIFSQVSFLFAQSSTRDDVHLFQSFFRDAPIAANPYGEGLFNFFDAEGSNSFSIGGQGGIAVTPEIELGSGLYYRSINPDGGGDGESGLLDIPVYGRYIFINEQQTKLSGGAYLTLPVGSEDIGQGNVNFGFFGAVRYGIEDNPVTLTGNLGIDFVETLTAGIGLIGFCPGFYFGYCAAPQYQTDREATLSLGGGVIYEASNAVNIVGEFRVQTEVDFAALSGGIDYNVSDSGRIRGNLLLGLDDGAPNIGLTGGFLLFFE